MTWEPSKQPTGFFISKNAKSEVHNFKINQLAVIKGLQNKPEKNGQIVRIDSKLNIKTGRYNVYLLKTNECAQLKPHNLTPHISIEPQIKSQKHTKNALRKLCKILINFNRTKPKMYV